MLPVNTKDDIMIETWSEITVQSLVHLLRKDLQNEWTVEGQLNE